MGMDEISDKLENWPDRTINLRVSSPWLLKTLLFYFVITINHSLLFPMFLKLADKEDMDEISDKFENWLDRIINLRVTSPWLLKKPLFDIVISKTHLGFDRMFLKLADKVDTDKISNKFKNWQDRKINLRVTSPWLLKKASVWLCHQRNSFSSNRMFLKLADNVIIDEISKKLKIWPDWIINLRVTFPHCCKSLK